jgi:hypothetical protein
MMLDSPRLARWRWKEMEEITDLEQRVMLKLEYW